MANPTPPPRDFRDQLAEFRRQVNDRIDRISGFDATQMSRAIDKLAALVEAFPDVANEVNTVTVNASGNVNAANVVATGAGTFPSGINSVGVYSNLLTSGSRAAYVQSGGALGYAPSSRKFKQDIADAVVPEVLWRTLRLVTFRYVAAVEEFGDDAMVEWGLIAEEVHDAGLTWLVDYDERGEPFGIKKDQIAMLLIPAVLSFDERLRAAGL